MMDPFQTCRQVVPAYIDHILYGGTVVACEERQEQLVTLVERPVQFRIDIIEIEGVVLEVGRELQEHIHIRAARGDEECRLVLQDGPLEGTLCREQADGGTTMIGSPL